MPEIAEPAGDVASWKVPEVAQWLEAHHFPPAAIESFRTNAVSGADLLQLTDDDLKEHLGLSSLLARKLRAELQKKGAAAPAAAAAPAPAAASAAADATAAAVAAAVTAALQAVPAAAAVAPAPVAAAPVAVAAAAPAVTSAGSAFNPADLDRYVELQKRTRELQGMPGQAAELEGMQRTMEGLVDRMFASAGGRQAELADAARVLEGKAAEANRSAGAFARGTQKLQNAAAALQEALAAMSRTQMLGAVNMGRGIGFQRRTGAHARNMAGRTIGNVAEMAVFRRANDSVAQAARDVQEASALLGPGMPRVDTRVLSTARAGMFANLLVGGTMSSAVQMAAVRRSMDQVRSLLGEVQACLSWAQQNLAAHQQSQANLAGQATAKRAEVDSIRRQELQEAVAARTAAATL